MITTLAQLIAQAESSNNAQALRFEPNYSANDANILAIKILHKCNNSTASTLASMSWGLYQIMGDNLAKMGLSVSLIDYLNSPDIQDDYFLRYCVLNGINYSLSEIQSDRQKLLNFATRYNGPGSPETYADYLLGFLK